MTRRAFITGLLLALGVGAAVPFLGLYVQGSNAGYYFTSQIAHLLLFLLLVVFNTLVGAVLAPGRFSAANWWSFSS